MSDGNKSGFTVSELEGKAKKYASEIGLGVIFAVTAIFTLIWGGAMMVWSILLCMALGIVGAVTPNSMMQAIEKALNFVYKEKAMLIATGVILLIVAIFIPVLIFALIGLVAGGYLSTSMKKKAAAHPDLACSIDQMREKHESKMEENKADNSEDNRNAQ